MPEAVGEGSTKGSRAPGDTLDEARRLIAAREFEGARGVLTRYLKQHPDDPDGLEMAGDGALHANDSAAAIGFFEAAVRASSNPPKGLWFKWAGATITAERPFDTIAVLREAVEDYPDVLEIRQNLASFLARMGLQNEAAEHLQWLVQRKHGSRSILLQLSDLTSPQTHEETCRSALRRNPEDLRPVFSLAQHDVAESNWKEVEKALAPVVKRHPDFLPALALYGRSLVELDDTESVVKWSQSLPREIEAYSHYWMASGNWAYRHGSVDQAARAYWSAVRLNEDDPEPLGGLSITLAKLGRREQAELVARRAEKLAALRGHVAELGAWDFDAQSAVVDLALTLHELGRDWEATNWLIIGASMKQHLDPRLTETLRRIRDQLTGATPWQQPEKTVAGKIDLSSFPTVNWRPSADETSLSLGERSGGTIRMRDEARSRSLRHVCSIDNPVGRESGLMIYQSGAGAAGVIDFDLDGWADLYLTVMDGTPHREDSHPNDLHRNLAGRFLRVTENSMLIDRGFSQGISVGDYNADGWPDVYVANIGKNRLYRNNGDGTFLDVTSQCGIDGIRWTTSVAIADLNGDGHADIYEVGYCSGEEPLVLECIVPSIGKARSCNPMAFDPEPDRIWAGEGDGTFSDATRWLGPREEGRGFALVVGDLDRRHPGLETYVANDMTANHYWARTADTSPFGLSEQAGIRGLAFNRRSMAQASMGIAAADADNDGDIDFLLTHFVDDHNTYYRQDPAGVWSDESQVAGFAEFSMPMLAYGTQWIDVDSDGALEVFIANGDIDDFGFEGRSFRQPAQLMKQVEPGRWQAMQADPLGDYFASDRLARAVATLDADRDGRTDLVVTHLFDPVALLMNRSETPNRQTRFFLRATSTHRDAIGTRIRFTSGGRTFEQQLLAGNGFQCVNEACIAFGVSGAETLENVQVTWPGGRSESCDRLDAGADYLFIEARGNSPLGPPGRSF
jgi:tetratricopeptide (TPR) repeat protein